MYVYPTEDVEERKRFCNDLDSVLNKVGDRYKLCGMGDMNGWVRIK